MINPKDFRIGDLVRICGGYSFLKGAACIVTQIDLELTYDGKKGFVILRYADGIEDDQWLVWCSDIEGIPLTAEILEKNGWDCELGHFLTYTHEAFRLKVSFVSHSEWVYVTMGYETLRKIRYVHELQHILWSLGYNAQMTYPSLPTLDIEAFPKQVEELDEELLNRTVEALSQSQNNAERTKMALNKWSKKSDELQ